MAERTARPATFEDGRAFAEYDYDDVTGQVLRVRLVNRSERGIFVRLHGGRGAGRARGVEYHYGLVAGGGEAVFEIPPGQRPHFPLVPDGGPPGRPDAYPTLGGLDIEAGTV